MIKKISLLSVFLFCMASFSTTSHAGLISFVNGPSVGPFNMGSSESRETLFEVLNDVTLTQLGALIDPSVDNQFVRWSIFNSDINFTFGSQLFTQVTDLGNDFGMSIYDLSVNQMLSTGFYILSLETLGLNLAMERFNENAQNLSFVTSDSNFRIIDGAANNGAGNSILPSFSVTTGSLRSVPEPSTLAIFALSIVGLVSRKFKKKV